MSFWTPRSAEIFSRPGRRPGYFLVTRSHDETRLPVPYMRPRRFRGPLNQLAKYSDVEIVSEFRSKMKAAEEMISKLAFNLKEIQGMRRPSTQDHSLEAGDESESPTLAIGRATVKITHLRKKIFKPVEFIGK